MACVIWYCGVVFCSRHPLRGRWRYRPYPATTTLSSTPGGACITVHVAHSYCVCVCVCVMCVFCSDAGISDRVVIQELLKETAQSQNLESAQRDFKGTLQQYIFCSLILAHLFANKWLFVFLHACSVIHLLTYSGCSPAHLLTHPPLAN